VSGAVNPSLCREDTGLSGEGNLAGSPRCPLFVGFMVQEKKRDQRKTKGAEKLNKHNTNRIEESQLKRKDNTVGNFDVSVQVFHVLEPLEV
jgi:hypothetical protein